MRPILALLIAIAFATQVHAEDAEIASLFSEAGVEGTIVIEKLDGNQRYVHNETRAAQRFPSASTFKIFNTLIALEEGALSGLDEVIRWDGRVHEFPDWNRDPPTPSRARTRSPASGATRNWLGGSAGTTIGFI